MPSDDSGGWGSGICSHLGFAVVRGRKRRYCTSIAETIASPLVGLNSRITMAIPGIHFETLLIRGQRASRGGCHIQICQNFLPVRENVENAVAGM